MTKEPRTGATEEDDQERDAKPESTIQNNKSQSMSENSTNPEDRKGGALPSDTKLSASPMKPSSETKPSLSEKKDGADAKRSTKPLPHSVTNHGAADARGSDIVPLPSDLPTPEPLPSAVDPPPRISRGPGAYAEARAPEFVHRTDGATRGVSQNNGSSQPPLGNIFDVESGTASVMVGSDFSGLVSAMAISDPTEAHPVDPTELNKQKQRRFKLENRLCGSRCARLIWVAIVVAIAATSTICAIVLGGPSKSSQNTVGYDEAPIQNTTIHLPDSILLAIQGDINGTSPQNKAYRWMQNDPWLSSYSEARLLQRFALATIYFATEGDHWTDAGGGTATVSYLSFNLSAEAARYTLGQPRPLPILYNVTSDAWLSYGTHECQWFSQASLNGLDVCDVHGYYRSIHLKNNGLSGSLPKEIGLLANLTDMNLWRSNMGGLIPSQVGLLTKLTLLNLAESQFSRTIPAQVGLLSNLQYINVINNAITGGIPSELYQLSTLQAFSVGRNKLPGSLPEHIGSALQGMKLLLIGRSGLTGILPTSLGKCTNLALLSAAQNQFTGPIPSELGRVRLGRIILAGNQLSGQVPSELGLVPSLRSLNLANNINLSGQFPTQLKKLNTTLESLSLEGTSITGTIPTELCYLEKLTFDCSPSLCGCSCPCYN